MSLTSALVDVGQNAADDVSLNRSGLFDLLAPFVAEPSVKDAGRESTGVHGEVLFHGLEGQCALFNQSLEDWGQVGILQVAEDTGARRGLLQKTVHTGASDVAHCPSGGKGGVDLEGDAEHHIGEGHPRASLALRRLGDGVAQLPEQDGKVVALVGLRRIVGGPVLACGNELDDLRLDGGAIRPFLSLDDEFHGIDVLAPLPALLEVRAGAERVVAGGNDVRAVAALRRYFVAQAVLLYLSQGGYRQAALLTASVAVVGIARPKGGNDVEAELPVHVECQLVVHSVSHHLLICIQYNRHRLCYATFIDCQCVFDSIDTGR